MGDDVEVNDASSDALGVRDRVGGPAPASRRRAVPGRYEDVAGPRDPPHGRLVGVDGCDGEGKTRLATSCIRQRAVAAPAGLGDEVVHVAVEGTDDLERDAELECSLGEECVRTFRKSRDGDDAPARGALGGQQRDALGRHEHRSLGVELAVTDDSQSAHDQTVRAGLDDAGDERLDELAPEVGARVAELERRELVHRDRRYFALTEKAGRTLLVSALVGWGVNIVALIVVDWVFDSIEIGRWGSLLLGAAVLGLANAIVKPVLALLTLPLILVTLGLSYFALNVLMLALAEWIAPDFSIDGFWTYVGATIIVWLVNWILNALLPDGD